MIIAAAIKFHIEKTDQDVVLCGVRHGDIFVQLKALGFQPHEGYKEIQQGFVTHKNEFLPRDKAFDHAKECGQIGKNIIDSLEYTNSDQLLSEDLW